MEKLSELMIKAPDLEIFMDFAKKTKESKVLDKKFKELLALAISVVIRCEPCILRHASEAINSGAKIEEIAEVLEVAVSMGGDPALAYAEKAFEIAKSLTQVHQR